MINVLVAGYGVMTRGVIPHIVQKASGEVFLMSRHLNSPPPGVTMKKTSELQDAPPDVILGCFESDGRSKEFWTTPEVLAAVARRGIVCIEMSTLTPGWVEDWHELIRRNGGSTVECPVTGSKVGAANGALSAFLYESEPDPRAAQVLDTFVKKKYHFSAPGNPARFKLVYNAWGAALLHTLTAFIPTLQDELAEDFGVAADIVTGDGWMSLVAASKLERMIDQDFGDPDFALKYMLKDLRYARGVLGESNSLVNLVYQTFLNAESIYGGSADYTAVTGEKIRENIRNR
ncbi:NAD(P)-binding domain-containing protein [Streptomyces sp. NPDC048349]|uniref:NAD(P)-binding domain-containing protein n=1 Tax=Streptomyces sp. NPDC048349 TaxID=3155486 RepID=UPI0034347EC0